MVFFLFLSSPSFHPSLFLFQPSLSLFQPFPSRFYDQLCFYVRSLFPPFFFPSPAFLSTFLIPLLRFSSFALQFLYIPHSVKSKYKSVVVSLLFFSFSERLS